MRRVAASLSLLALSTTVWAQQPSRAPLQINFTPSADSFLAATEEYRALWKAEGPRIVATMERVSGLRFEPGPIEATVYEGTSFSGEPGGRPMMLRASYPEPTKRGTLVHELGHRLANDVVVPFDHHELIFLFVYDAWMDLWGKPFADDQVAIEGKRLPTDYAGMWKKTLALSADERAAHLQEAIKQYRKPQQAK